MQVDIDAMLTAGIVAEGALHAVREVAEGEDVGLNGGDGRRAVSAGEGLGERDERRGGGGHVSQSPHCKLQLVS
jgi:hypothetical protein